MMPLELRKKTLIVKILISSVFGLFVSACGVKGDPVPPDKAAEIGRGQPTYRKATEKIPLQKYSPADDEDKKDEEPEDE